MTEDKQPETKKNEWFYWRRSPKGNHFIIFRQGVACLAQAKIFVWDTHNFEWHVTGPCHFVGEPEGRTRTLDEAKRQVEEVVFKIIEEEFKPEFIPPLG